jgi:hypothetical protein
MPSMSDWQNVPAEEVRVGDRVRLANGTVVEVSRIEAPFMGVDAMLALIEDTSSRWYKQPLPKGTEVEVERSA